MTPERKAQVLALRAEGMTYSAIAERLEVSKSVVYRIIHPDRAAATDSRRRVKKQAWARENYRGRCACGNPTGKRSVTTCKPCDLVHRAEVHALVLDTVQAMFEEGWAYREMATAFSHKTEMGCGPWLLELRKAGRIGYRYQRGESAS